MADLDYWQGTLIPSQGLVSVDLTFDLLGERCIMWRLAASETNTLRPLALVLKPLKPVGADLALASALPDLRGALERYTSPF